MHELILVINGFVIAVVCGILGVAIYALRLVRKGQDLLKTISEVHNAQAEIIAEVDKKASEANLRLDHINNVLGPNKKGPF